MGEPSSYLQPPRLHKDDGAVRRVGLEIEFAGVDVSVTTAAVIETLGGTTQHESPFDTAIDHPRWGTFRVELDSRPLKRRRHMELLAELGVDVEHSRFATWLDDSIREVASVVVPCEVVTPPIPMTELSELDPLWRRLQQLEAEGTRASVLNAFGLHLNIELQELSVDTMLGQLRAYMLSSDWIASRSRIDFSRRVTPYIDSFPEEYRRKVLDPQYAPNRERFIEDYLRHNPTRNRALDLLPLLAYLKPAIIDMIEDAPELIKPRPAWHYRLPNSEIDEEAWTPAGDWNRWVAVERLAADPSTLRTMSEAYLGIPRLPWRLHADRWAEHAARWLEA